MDSGSGAGARAAACPTRKERLELRKQRYVDLRRAMWSARVRLDQGRKKKEEEKEREEKETEDMMWEDQFACWLENKMEKMDSDSETQEQKIVTIFHRSHEAQWIFDSD